MPQQFAPRNCCVSAPLESARFVSGQAGVFMISCSFQFRSHLRLIPRAALHPPLSLPHIASGTRRSLNWTCTSFLLPARPPYPAWLLFSLAPSLAITAHTALIHQQWPEYPPPLAGPSSRCSLFLSSGPLLRSIRIQGLPAMRDWTSSLPDGPHLTSLLSPRHLLGWLHTASPLHLLALMPT